MRPPNILVVEDDLPLRQVYKMALTLAGFEVREVGDGYEALRALEERPPDLVVLDLMLPRVNGNIVRQEMAARAHMQKIPVVVVTGAADGPDLNQLEADCVMKKPITPDMLVETVRKCLASGAR